MKKADQLFKELLNENLGYIDLKPINQIEATPKADFETKFAAFLAEEVKEEDVKIDSKKVAKSVEEIEGHNFDYKDPKNLDNQIGQEVMNGIYFEAKQNPDKTIDEIKEIVSKNLTKDRQYYIKNAAFGVEGLGYQETELEEVSGKYAASGYSDKLKKVVKESLMGESYDEFQRDDKGAKGVDKKNKGEEEAFGAGVEKGEKIEKKKLKKETLDTELSEIDKQAQIVALEAKLDKMDEVIEGKMSRINMVSEDENLSELVDSKKMKAMQKEVKVLEKRKAKMEKMYEKMAGKKYQREEIVGEVEVEELQEMASSNLELKSMAKQLYLGFKKMGADVQLVTNKAVINKAKTGDVDEKNVWIYQGDDNISITLVGDKAISFEDKIKNDPAFAKFEFPKIGFADGETWGGQKTRTIKITPGATTSE